MDIGNIFGFGLFNTFIIAAILIAFASLF